MIVTTTIKKLERGIRGRRRRFNHDFCIWQKIRKFPADNYQQIADSVILERKELISYTKKVILTIIIMNLIQLTNIVSKEKFTKSPFIGNGKRTLNYWCTPS